MDEQKTKIINRLRRIEGQVKGIERMLDSEQCCSDILVQVAAVRRFTTLAAYFRTLCPKLPGGGCNPEGQQQALSESIKHEQLYYGGRQLPIRLAGLSHRRQCRHSRTGKKALAKMYATGETQNAH